jgi:hypothetical protein
MNSDIKNDELYLRILAEENNRISLANQSQKKNQVSR